MVKTKRQSKLQEKAKKHPIRERILLNLPNTWQGLKEIFNEVPPETLNNHLVILIRCDLVAKSGKTLVQL